MENFGHNVLISVIESFVRQTITLFSKDLEG